MPFRSKAQMAYMFANMPTIARRWAAHTKNVKALPKKARRK